MPVYGEPLTLRNAVALYSAQSAYGTPVTPATSCGLALAGHTKRSGNQTFRGPGSANFLARKGGTTGTDWTLSWPAVQAGVKTLLGKGFRTAGALPLITLGFGWKDDTGTPVMSADQIQDCKAGSVSMALDASSGHGPLTASMSGMGGLVTVLTTLSPATLTTAPHFTYEGVLTQDGNPFEVRNFSLDINHNLKADTVIPGATPSTFKRGHKYLTERQEVITGSVTRFVAIGQAVQANVVEEEAMVLVMTNLGDASTLTLTFTSVTFDNENFQQAEDGLLWSADYEAKTVALT